MARGAAQRSTKVKPASEVGKPTRKLIHADARPDRSLDIYPRTPPEQRSGPSARARLEDMRLMRHEDDPLFSRED